LWKLPPILKRSKVEITACSGLSGPVSSLDSESLLSRTLFDRVVRPALMSLGSRGLVVNGDAMGTLSREARYEERKDC
jgi:hypothetical protein